MPRAVEPIRPDRIDAFMTSRGCAETEAAAKAMDRAPPSGIKHRGLVDEELGRAQYFVTQQPPYGFDFRRGIADPESQGRPIDRDPLSRQDLGLAVKRAM